MRIGELAKTTGVDVETVRYYEREGLLQPPERQPNGYRAYDENQLERLAFIRHCRALDIPIIEIRRLIEFLDSPQGYCGEIDRLIGTHLAQVRARLKSVRALERQLTKLYRRCGANRAAYECGIMHELIVAAQGEACVCHGKEAMLAKSPRGTKR